MYKKLNCLFVVLLLVFMTELPVSAFSKTAGTSYTRTPAIDGNLEKIQDAYLPSDTLFMDLGLKGAQDMCIVDDKMYIADTDNKRILVYNLNSKELKVIKNNLFEKPTSVSADKNGKIYVADNEKAIAYRLSAEGVVEQEFKKPKSLSFGKNAVYKPLKIAPADGGGAYIVGEGAYSGIIHMNGKGEFIGYFVSNNTKLSFLEIIQDMFFTKEQKSQLIKKLPPSFSNLTRGEDGLLYTLTQGKGKSIKKHSISGLNMLKSSDVEQVINLVDIATGQNGQIYCVDKEGYVFEFTSDGEWVCVFAGTSNKVDRVGLFSVPSGIAVDSKERIYVLDSEKNLVQGFDPTPVTLNIHQAGSLYNEGKYTQSKQVWQKVLSINSMSRIAHIGIGRTYLQESDYENAAAHFKIAGYHDGYSTAYWEIRNKWLNKNVGMIISGLLLCWILFALLKLLNRKYKYTTPLKNKLHSLKKKPFIRDFAAIKSAILSPINTSYSIKYKECGSYLSATIIYTVLFIELVFYQIGSGFLFSVSDIAEYSVFNTAMQYVVIVGLFLVGNYLISSINDGEGTFRSIYIATAYMFSFATVCLPLLTILGNFLTIGEVFVMDFAKSFVMIWCLVSMIAMLIEVHNYSFKEVIKNIALTLFFMVVAILAASVVYLLLNQVFDFLYSLFQEVFIHV